MKILIDKDIEKLFIIVSSVMFTFLVTVLLVCWILYEEFVWILLPISLIFGACILTTLFWYVNKQNKILETAISQINAYLAGDVNARIDCDSEGELYKLFHAVNTLAAVLSAQAENELQAKEFLKNTISDISHQLKTPLAALNIYNGLLQNESEESPAIKEFTTLSEQELDRIETLVQSLLKITKLDAGTIIIDKKIENLADMMKDIELYFAFRAKQEQKIFTLSGNEDTKLLCDREWMIEAISNIVKNSFDHTSAGNSIQIAWKEFSSYIQITIKDNGCGIHAEDIYHIFKRFYRSRFSKDTQGIGLGLPLTKAIVEAHDGSVTVDSSLGGGSTFTLSFINPTNL